MKIFKKNMLFFTIVLNFLLINSLLIAKVVNGVEVPTATREIEFELEVQDTISVEPVYLDFGNILKNNKNLVTANSYFILTGAYTQDMLLSTSFENGTIEGSYTKFQIFREGNTAGDSLDVYLYNIDSRILSSGETKIPVVGEIREVKDITLGKYEKTVKMNVIITPMSPILNKRGI